MGGLVGAVTGRDAIPVLMEALKRLESQETQEFDSAGIAVLNGGNALTVRRCVGKVSELEKSLLGRGPAHLGIGHMRWATHGAPSERNAHPHVSHNSVAVAANGEVENYERLRYMLMQEGYAFTSDTDSEVIAHLVHYYLTSSGSLFEAVRTAVSDMTGAYAFTFVATRRPDVLIAVRHGKPLLLGISEGEQFVASDASALLPWTRKVIELEEGDIAEVKRDDINIVDALGQPVVRELRTLEGEKTG
jgi:glucosamine--fructose-6-phosphate aminotransferase (isomerizing)